MNKKTYFQIIFAISMIGMIISLYVSSYGDPVHNIMTGDLRNPVNAKFACTLCRYTRILLFPLTFISAVALRKKDRSMRKPIGIMSALGLAISIYTYGLEMNRWTKIEGICGMNSIVSCGQPAILRGGRFTLAFGGILSFMLIILCCLRIRKYDT